MRRAPRSEAAAPVVPGPGPMPPPLVRALELTVTRRVEGLLAGEHRSSLLGAGTELAQVRPYRPGEDDVRLIDWNVTARTGEPHVRVHLAERVLVSWLLLDLSASMDFGTADRRKRDVAAGVALALGHVATRRGNRLGIVAFDDAGSVLRPPRQGRPGLHALHEALAGGFRGGRETLASALRRTAAVARQRSLVAVVSDCRGPRDWRAPLLDVAARHDVLAVEIRDPREDDLPSVGTVWLVDPETGRQVRADTSSARLRERFRAAAAAEREEVARDLAAVGAHHVVLSTEGDWLRHLATALHSRERRR